MKLGLSNHAIAILVQACGCSRHPVTCTQDRIMHQWAIESKTTAPLKAYFGIYFKRDIEGAQPQLVESRLVPGCHICTFTDTSLLLSNEDRIFRLCVSIGPPSQLRRKGGAEHWCLNCHLVAGRHRHASSVFKADNLGSLADFITAGKERRGASPHPDDPTETDKLLPEVRLSLNYYYYASPTFRFYSGLSMDWQGYIR